MGKYEPLARYLNSRPDDTWNATFGEIEDKLGATLPRSAREHRAWWANQTNGNHSQTAGWRDAGWETREVDLRRGLVRFERRPGEKVARSSALRQGRPDLWERARELTGIDNRDALIEEALIALIRREAGRRLIALGGTMPDFTAPPRERPSL